MTGRRTAFERCLRGLAALAVLGLGLAPIPAAAVESVSPSVDGESQQADVVTSDDVLDDVTAEVVRTELGDAWRSEPTASGWALPVTFLGWGADLAARTGDSIFSLTVPESNGHDLERIEFTAALSAYVIQADVVISVDRQIIATITVSDSGAVDVVVDLPATRSGSTIVIEVIPEHSACRLGDETPIASLGQVVLFFGTAVRSNARADEMPAPDVATGIDFVLDDPRRPAVAQAAITLASELAQFFPGEQRFTVSAAATDVSKRSPFTQTIDVRESTAPGISVEDGAIVIAGEGERLQHQAAGFTDLLGSLNTVTNAVLGETTADDESPFGGRSVSAITRDRLRVAGDAHLELPIVLDQADFGGPVDQYELLLSGIATPNRLNGDDRIGLAVWIDEALFDVIELDDAGRFTIDTVIDQRWIGRTNTIRLVLDGVRSGCDDLGSYSIQLDRDSWVEPLGGQSLPAGLGRFPQVAADGLLVDPGRTQSDLTIAVDTVGRLQETTTRPLMPMLSPGFVGGGPGAMPTGALVVNPGSQQLDALGAPFNEGAGRIDTGTVEITVDGPVDDLDMAFQGFVTDAGDDVIVVQQLLPESLTSEALEQLDGALYRSSDGRLERVDVARASGAASEAPPEVLALEIDDTGSAPWSKRELFALGLFGTLAAGGSLVLIRRMRGPSSTH